MRHFDFIPLIGRLAALTAVVAGVLWLISLFILVEVNVCMLGRSWNLALLRGSVFVEYPLLATTDIDISCRAVQADFDWYTRKYEGGWRAIGFVYTQPAVGSHLIGVPLWPAVGAGFVGWVVIYCARRRRLRIPPVEIATATQR